MFSAVLFDIDGTLVDSNDAHAHAWVDAFSESNVHVTFSAVRRCIGMGGDKLIAAVSGLTEDSAEGRRISTRRREIFKSIYLPQVRPFPGVPGLVAACSERGLTLAAASSAKKDELEPLLKVAGVERLLDAATSSDDADESKPDPDIVAAALRRLRSRPSDAVLIGDTPYDVEAARRAGVNAIAFRCGGWSDPDLSAALRVYDGPWDLLEHLDESPICQRP